MMRQFMTATFTDLVLRVVLAFVLSATALGATGIWCAWPIGWTVATVFSILFYRAGPWKERAPSPAEVEAVEEAGAEEEDVQEAEAVEAAEVVI